MTDEIAAERWWDNLPPRRRVQIHNWIVAPQQDPGEIPGQVALIDPKEQA